MRYITITTTTGLGASVVVFRSRKASIGELTHEEDVFFLDANLDIPGAELLIGSLSCNYCFITLCHMPILVEIRSNPQCLLHI